MAEREIKTRAFTYYEEVPHPTRKDETIIRRRLVRKGDVVDLDKDAIERGERYGSFVTDEDKEAEENAFDAATADVDEIRQWIEDEDPIVQETIDASGGDPEVAQKILEAERQATGDDPRETVVKGLGAVIERGKQ